MRVLVAGGAGFIGSAVCRRLLNDLGRDVVFLDKLTYAADLKSLAPFAGRRGYALEQARSAMRRRSGASSRPTGRTR